MNFQRSGRQNIKKMASYGLEAVNEPLEEAASQLSLDSLRDHKNAPYSLNFSRVRCICQEFICLTTNSLWKIDDSFFFQFSLLKALSAI